MRARTAITCSGIFELVRDEIDAEIAAIGGHGRAVPVDDPAPARRDQPHLHAIGFGEAAVTLVLGDRDIAHPAGEQSREAELARADQQGAAAEGRGLGRLGDRRARPALHRPSRQRSSVRMMRVTTG